ncbi:MAG TPA: hypothetical protein VF999_01475 [Thermoanaerobaculia bacterium]
MRETRKTRIDGLRRRGEFERDVLAREVAGLRAEIERTGSRWKTAGWIAGGLAAAWTVGNKLFGKHSLSAKVGRLASAASVLFGLGRAVGRARKFW